ncbi:MAG: OmpA family protein [Candidatus Obscuribacterales bacterium]|nr:OmpA family protein [Cyanobacteria bacterium HKST-UBA01]MCB9470597.1 OmpA family protein [Candidatus Obscuribacterales bacterium]
MKVSKDGCKHRLSIFGDTLFDFDKYDLTDRAEETLNALGPMLHDMKRKSVEVEGHTDSIGTDEYNQELSLKRARAVSEWLVSHGFLDSGATIKGYGESRPVAANTYSDGSDNAAGRQKNRRVEIVIDTCN